MKLFSLFFLCTALSVSNPLHARQSSLLDEVTRTLQSRIDKAPAGAQIESGFSPEGGAERLVLKVIDSATHSIHLAAYSFTSPKVTRALLGAKRRGVDVQIVVDDSVPKSKAGVAALNLMSNAGIPVRINSRYAIHHDKYIVADERNVQTGSFNYSRAAAESNSENVIVVWQNAELAASYLKHWESRFDDGEPYKANY